MTLEGKFGQLLSDGNFVGTAWLLSIDLAITAHHCLFDGDNIRPNLTIKFSVLEIEVSSYLQDSDLDVAILKITNSNYNELVPLIIPMSHTRIALNDDIFIGGYPNHTQSSLPNGTIIPAKVKSPDWTKRIVMTYHGGEIPEIVGVSGGPLILQNDQLAAIGLICAKFDTVQELYATSIFKIVERFPELESLLLNSPHIDRRSKRLCIDQTQDNKIRWSCSVPIDEAEKLWEDPTLVTHVSCLLPLSSPGAVNDASKRLLWNGRFTEIVCYQADDTLKRLGNRYLELEAEMQPSDCQWKNPPQGSSLVNAACSLPKTPEVLSQEAFVEKLNNSLDIYVLNKIHHNIEECDSGDINRIVGSDIEQVLWREMYEVWLGWYQLLNSDAILRHQYLSHCLLATASNKTSSRDTILLGPKTSMLRLTRPTVMALALAASDIPIKPYLSNPGNFSIESNTGHACGVDRFSGRGVLYAASNAWLTDVVMLPYFNLAYLLYYQQLQSMRKNPSTSPRVMDSGLPPLVLTGDLEWEMALASGKIGVKGYYQKRVDETKAFCATQNLDSRDGGLKNAP